MKKYIHYCWFGDKKLSKLAKKCINSWKKQFPEYELKLWNESNSNLDECPFVKGAYEQKKWAFVADYIRTKALKEYGGLYFDTDMEVTKDISDILESNETVLGVEDTGVVAVGFWYEQKKDAFLPTKLLEKYQSFKKFPINEITIISIPKLLTDLIDDDKFIKGGEEIQKLNHNVTIYPREYFYPLSYNHVDNVFTDNTRMVHYYDASWIPTKDKIILKSVRKHGLNKTLKNLERYRKAKDVARKTAKIILFPYVIYRNRKRYNMQFNEEYSSRINNTVNLINNSTGDYITIYNEKWFGTASATKELFENLVDSGELLRKKDVVVVGDAIINKQIKQVIFSAFAIGWANLAKYLKEKDNTIKIKTFFHGSHSQVLDSYGWDRNMEIYNLHKDGIVSVMGTCKASLVEFYKKMDCNVYFLTNKVTTDIKPQKSNEKITIGIYAAKCDDWRKNMFAQIAAVGLVKDAEIDMVPLNPMAIEFAKMVGVKISGIDKPIPREELMKRMAKNNVNLYVTFSECAPMLPLESMELDVPCITGNNHHYFKNLELENFIVVKNEESVKEISEKIKLCIKNKETILKLYDDFAINNLKESKKQIKEFIEM